MNTVLEQPGRNDLYSPYIKKHPKMELFIPAVQDLIHEKNQEICDGNHNFESLFTSLWWYAMQSHPACNCITISLHVGDLVCSVGFFQDENLLIAITNPHVRRPIISSLEQYGQSTEILVNDVVPLKCVCPKQLKLIMISPVTTVPSIADSDVESIPSPFSLPPSIFIQ